MVGRARPVYAGYKPDNLDEDEADFEEDVYDPRKADLMENYTDEDDLNRMKLAEREEKAQLRLEHAKRSKAISEMEKEGYDLLYPPEEKLRLEEAREKSELRAMRSEAFELEHPNYISARGRAGKAGKRLSDFAGKILVAGSAPLRSKARRTRIKPYSMSASSAGRASISDDISLTRAIAVNDWSGSGNIMQREFFGSRDDRDLIGDRNRAVNIGSSFEMDFFGPKKKVNLLGSTNRNKELIGDRNKKINLANKKNIRYF